MVSYQPRVSRSSTEETVFGQVQAHSKECLSPLHVTLSCIHQVLSRENTRPPLAHRSPTGISKTAFVYKLRLAGQAVVFTIPVLGYLRAVAHVQNAHHQQDLASVFLRQLLQLRANHEGASMAATPVTAQASSSKRAHSKTTLNIY